MNLVFVSTLNVTANIQESRLEKLLTFVGTTLHIQLEISTIFLGEKRVGMII